ncbi:MAG: D-alanyl-D-alanine carboxypeptidase family protein [Bacillota bacterium]|nr:D-alanyl-D-alanine carboxypeptidase family protein [Bacillota bacterium]
MFYFNKIMGSILIVLIGLTFLSSRTVWAEDPPPPIAGEYGVAIDAATGDILYNKNADGQAFPASMTKVLTSIVLDEKVADNQMLTVSPNAAGQECSCFGLTAGEKISKQDAMYGLLLLSANDLAVTIAENVGGNVEGFAQLMNEEVQKLGLQHTHFVTPNGLHDPNHYTTPHDMALIMKEALKHPKVLNALSTQSIEVHTSLQDKHIKNKSDVHTQPESAHVIAGKTGFTDQAGNTLVEYLKDGGKEVIAVVMKSHKQEEYSDIQTMANYAFSHMKTKKIASKNEVIDKRLVNGEKVNLIAPEDIVVGLKNDDHSKLTTKVELASTAGEVIKKGQLVANLKILKGKVIIKEVPLVTNKTIKATQKILSMKMAGNQNADTKKPIGLLGITLIPAGIIILFFVVYIAWNRNAQNQKKMVSK